MQQWYVVFEVFYIIGDFIDSAYSNIAGFWKKRRKKTCYFVAYLVIINVIQAVLKTIWW